MTTATESPTPTTPSSSASPRRRRALACIAVVVTSLVAPVVLSSAAGATVVNPTDSRDQASTYVYCNARDHTVGLRTIATQYWTYTMRNVYFVPAGGTQWRSVDGWKLPQNQVIWYNLSTLAGYRLYFYAQYTYSGYPGEYPPIYQFNPQTGAWNQSSICYV